jgi:hypothetical protein
MKKQLKLGRRVFKMYFGATAYSRYRHPESTFSPLPPHIFQALCYHEKSVGGADIRSLVHR